MVVPSAALLALPLTVAVHRLKKPFIYAGFNNLMTDETQISKASTDYADFRRKNCKRSLR